MKRIGIVVLVFLLILGVCLYTLHRVKRMRDTVFEKVDAIFVSIQHEDRQALADQVGELTRYWKEEESTLLHYVRHAQVDEITGGMARLPALVRYEDYSELSASLESILWQIEHIWQTEIPSLQNLLMVRAGRLSGSGIVFCRKS